MKKKENGITVYQKFRKLNMDPAIIGLGQSEKGCPYFCTPKGARIIGWAGVDGIHYCFIPGFGEMVFAVSPSNTPGTYVHPIARSFEDLLRLLLACGSMDALEQAHAFDEHFFYAYCEQNPPGAEQAAVFATLQDQLGITPMEKPYAYLRQLQNSFDYSRIPYTADYYDMDIHPAAEPKKQDWKVTYDGGFSPRRGYAGKVMVMDKSFFWGGALWHIPAAYICGKGIVVDLCMEVDPKKVTAFIEKWDLLHEEEHSYSADEQEQIQNEQPLNMDFRSSLTINGKELQSEHGYGCTWIAPSCLPEGFEADHDAKEILEHYGLDPSQCWAIHRVSYRWAASRKPEIRSVRLHLEQDPVNLPGTRFRTPAVGESVSFMHPVSGTEHKLTVQEYENREINTHGLQDKSMEYPTHYAAMAYTLSPDLSGQRFMLRDCAPGNTPRYRTDTPAVSSTAGIGIIGGADGPTAIFIAPVSPEAHSELHTACSALHFEPAQTVEWKMIFREKNIPDTDIDLL